MPGGKIDAEGHQMQRSIERVEPLTQDQPKVKRKVNRPLLAHLLEDMVAAVQGRVPEIRSDGGARSLSDACPPRPRIESGAAIGWFEMEA